MLDIMRKHAKNWIMKLLLGIIVVVFVFYFGSLREGNQADIIATIDGKPISFADFQREYQNLLDLYGNRFGGSLTEEQLKVLNLKEQAVDSLIKQVIITETAKELNIRVSDQEVKNAILSYPAFQRNNQFDKRIYEETLRHNKMSPENFEINQRKLLLSKKLQELIISGVLVSEQEVFDLYRLQNEKININFLKFSWKDYANAVKPTQTALETYLKEHGEELRIPEQIQLKYLTFQAADYASAVKIAENEIKDYYERNKERLAKGAKQQPSLEEVRETIIAELRHKSGMSLAAAEAKKAHDTIYQQENFDAYTAGKSFKIHLSPLFSAVSIPPEFRLMADFSKSVFPLQKNEISRILSNDRGYYLFQVALRKLPYIPDLKEAEKEVTNRYIKNESILLCLKEAETILERLKKGEQLENIAREKKIKIGETGMFLPGSTIPELGVSEQINEALAQLSETKPYPDKIFSINDNFIVVRFKQRGKLDDSDFSSRKEELKMIFKELKNSETLNAWIEGVKSSMLKEGRLKITKDIKGT